MPSWKKSLMTTAFLDSTVAYLNEPCQVVIDNNKIVVSYPDENEVVLYKGKSQGKGHFQLVCPERNGKASLHMFDGGFFLDGYWVLMGTGGY